MNGVKTGAHSGYSGLVIAFGSSTVKGLEIVGFSGIGISISGNGGNTIARNVISGNYIYGLYFSAVTFTSTACTA